MRVCIEIDLRDTLSVLNVTSSTSSILPSLELVYRDVATASND